MRSFRRNESNQRTPPTCKCKLLNPRKCCNKSMSGPIQYDWMFWSSSFEKSEAIIDWKIIFFWKVPTTESKASLLIKEVVEWVNSYVMLLTRQYKGTRDQKRVLRCTRRKVLYLVSIAQSRLKPNLCMVTFFIPEERMANLLFFLTELHNGVRLPVTILAAMFSILFQTQWLIPRLRRGNRFLLTSPMWRKLQM